MRNPVFVLIVLLFVSFCSICQVTDTVPTAPDTAFRIINFNPFFSQHVDSPNVYQFRINKPSVDYFWHIIDAPVGLSINKDNGMLTFKAARNYFLSGKLKYDIPYKVTLSVQSLLNPIDRIDSVFSISFY